MKERAAYDQRDYPEQLSYCGRRHYAPYFSVLQLSADCKAQNGFSYRRYHRNGYDNLQYHGISFHGNRQKYHAYEDFLSHKLLYQRTCNAAVYLPDQRHQEKSPYSGAVFSDIQCSALYYQYIQRLYIRL